MTPTAGTVLGLRNGGNTLMGGKPAGSRAKEAARVGLGMVGEPPPPGVPAAGAPDGTDPGAEKAVIIKPGIKKFHESLIIVAILVQIIFGLVDQNFLDKNKKSAIISIVNSVFVQSKIFFLLV